MITIAIDSFINIGLVNCHHTRPYMIHNHINRQSWFILLSRLQLNTKSLHNHRCECACITVMVYMYLYRSYHYPVPHVMNQIIQPPFPYFTFEMGDGRSDSFRVGLDNNIAYFSYTCTKLLW